MSPSANISGRACIISGARNGRRDHQEIRTIPLSIGPPTRPTTIGVGSSAYVSGIQVWNGKTGVLTREREGKAGENPRAPGRADPRRAGFPDDIGRAGRQRRMLPSRAAARARRRDCRANTSSRFGRAYRSPRARENTGSSIRSQNSAKSSTSLAKNKPRSSRPGAASSCAHRSRVRGPRTTATAHTVTSASSSTSQYEIAPKPRWNDATKGRESQCTDCVGGARCTNAICNERRTPATPAASDSWRRPCASEHGSAIERETDENRHENERGDDHRLTPNATA